MRTHKTKQKKRNYKLCNYWGCYGGSGGGGVGDGYLLLFKKKAT